MTRRVAAWVVRLELPILLLATPFLVFPNAARSPVMLVVPLLWVARRRALGRFVRRTPNDWALALLLLMVLVSTIVTFDILFSLPKIAGIVLGVGFYYALAELDFKWFRPAVAVYLAGGVALAGLGIFGLQLDNKLPLVSGLVDRIPPLFSGIVNTENGLNPNEVGGALLWFVPVYFALAASLITRRGARQRVLLAALLLVGGLLGSLALLVGQSRSAILGLAVALLLLLWLSGRWGRIATMLIAAAGLITFVAMGAPQLLDAASDAPATAAYLGSLDASSRVEIWERALYAIQDFPFTGVGLNNFRRIVPLLYPTLLIPPGMDIAHAHNHMLQVAVDVGLPGLVAWLALWGATGAMLVVIWRRSAPGPERAAAAGFAAGLLAWAVYGLTDTIALGAKPGIVFWMLLGLIALLFLSRPRSKILR